MLYCEDGADDFNYESDREKHQEVSVPVGNIKVVNEQSDAKAKNDQGGVLSPTNHSTKGDEFTGNLQLLQIGLTPSV